MKSRIATTFLLLLCVGSAEPEFVGFLRSESDKSDTQFVIVVEPGTSPRWAKLGQNIGRYIISEFRLKDEVLVLKSGGREILLKLKPSKVQHVGYRGRSLPLEVAKQLVASVDGWQTDVTYNVFKRSDGSWSLCAAKRFGNVYKARFVPVMSETVPEEIHDGR